MNPPSQDYSTTGYAQSPSATDNDQTYVQRREQDWIDRIQQLTGHPRHVIEKAVHQHGVCLEEGTRGPGI